MIKALIILFTLQFSINPGHGAEPGKNKRDTKKKRTTKSYIDGTQRFISDFWVDLNYNMDTYFSDEIYDKKENKSRIIAFYEIFKKESLELREVFDIKIKFHLPKLSKRLSITIEKERDEILESRTSQATKGQAARDSKLSASLNYQLQNIPFFKTDVSSGFRFILPLDPFAKLKFFKDFQTQLMDIHFEQMFIYYRQDYFKEYSQLSFSKVFSDNFSYSQSNTLSWSDEDDTFVIRNNLSLNQRLDDRNSLTYSLGANAFLRPTYHYDSYDASIGYNKLLYEKWLFGFLSIGADFPRLKNWDMSNFVVLRTEILFQ